jgi:hypothetical protein
VLRKKHANSNDTPETAERPPLAVVALDILLQIQNVTKNRQGGRIPREARFSDCITLCSPKNGRI